MLNRLSHLAKLSIGGIALAALTVAAGCGGADTTHGTITELSAVGHGAELCAHEVPEEVCTRCHPELEPQFRAANDWCGPHGLPESQCLRCHPDLTFAPLPPVPEGADVVELSEAEALEGLEAHAVPGRVTVFDFHAPWCAPCRNLEGHLNLRLADTPELSIRRIDVAAWEGPVVERYMADVAGLPYVVVYGPDGTRAGELSSFEPEEIDALIDQALANE